MPACGFARQNPWLTLSVLAFSSITILHSWHPQADGSGVGGRQHQQTWNSPINMDQLPGIQRELEETANPRGV